MTDLRELADSVGEAFKDRAKRAATAAMIIKLVLITGGSALAGVAQFLAIPKDQPFTVWNFIGIIAVIIAGLGGFALAIRDKDGAEELELARQALARAQQIEEDYAWVDTLIAQQVRAAHLYSATSAMRGAIERLAVAKCTVSEQDLRAMLTVGEPSLLGSLGFEVGSHWTLGIYVNEPDAQTRSLRLFATSRSTPCDVTQARRWPAGVGVAGTALAQSREVIVPDLAAPELGTLHDLSGSSRPYDDDRYRSIAAVPIMVGAEPEPWGVVVATSSQPKHFEVIEQGVQAAEGVRALAGMVALALAVQHSPTSLATGAQESPHPSVINKTERSSRRGRAVRDE